MEIKPGDYFSYVNLRSFGDPEVMPAGLGGGIAKVLGENGLVLDHLQRGAFNQQQK